MRTATKVLAGSVLVTVAGLMALSRLLESVAEQVDAAHVDFEESVRAEVESWSRMGQAS